MDNERRSIWNRACMELGGINPHEGDVALVALLALHGPAMNGGLTHSCELLGASKCAVAVQGFRFFGLEELARLVEQAMQPSDEDSEVLDDQYFDLVPRDDVLEDAFVRKWSRSPEAFAPVEEQAS